ncbi:MAG: hypothetical protein HY865_05505 [Chloroflexi bacterium]|nr:hypothetical protein [Chloroflexota bacterium]
MEIHIGHSEHEFILLDVISRSYPNSNDSYDGNWLDAKAIVKVGGFTGTVIGQLTTDELASFQAELANLYKSLSGSAKFVTLEGWLSFEITGDGMGHLSCTGIVIDGFVQGNTFNFNLNIDQTFCQRF